MAVQIELKETKKVYLFVSTSVEIHLEFLDFFRTICSFMTNNKKILIGSEKISQTNHQISHITNVIVLFSFSNIAYAFVRKHMLMLCSE